MAGFSWTSALTGALGAGLITLIWNTLRDHFKTNKDGQFAGLYLSVALESYASELLSSIYDSTNYDASDGHAGQPLGNVALITFPEDLDWKSLGIKITTTSLTFKIKVEGVASMISASREFDDDGGATEVAAQEQSVAIALEAWDYAVDFRRTWGLPRVGGDDDGKTVRDYLNELSERFRTRRVEREERIRKYREANPDSFP